MLKHGAIQTMSAYRACAARSAPRGLNVLQGLEPAQAGLVCVAAISIAWCV